MRRRAHATCPLSAQRPTVLPALLLALAGCSAGSADGGSDPGDAGPAPGDAAPYCQMNIAITPEMPRAPQDVVATAEIASGSLIGFRDYEWSVRRSGQPVDFEVTGVDAQQITFTADAPGQYEITLFGSVDGTECGSEYQLLSVVAPDAASTGYRLRFLPRPEQNAVPYERVDTIADGIDYYLGRLFLPSGLLVDGTLRDEQGNPLAAYLRAVRVGELARETFADTDGSFRLRVSDLGYDLLIVPEDASIAPARVAAPTSYTWTITLPASEQATGVVLDPDGQAVADARVSMSIDGAPAAVVRTDEFGAFSVPVRAGELAELAIVPPDESGLPRLTLAADSALAAAALDAPLEVAYAPGLAIHSVAPTARSTSGSALAGVRATWNARSLAVPAGAPLDAAGALAFGTDASAALAASAHASALSGSDGTWPALDLPRGLYDVILEPPADAPADEAVTRLLIDVDGSSVNQLELVRAATVRGRVLDDSGAGLAEVQIAATPRGLLAPSAAANAVTRSDDDGAFTLALAPDTEYGLTLDGDSRSYARTRLDIVTPAAGTLSDELRIDLVPAAKLTGQVFLLDGAAGAPGVVVQLLCLACDDTEPLAEAVSDKTGTFVLAVPAPTPAE
ncbi:carboxypeptidase-like regulatory domain-containing protein [Haliangium ochraceum]|uniref:Carboxypeptidase regulatory-like domain-containing protein n=1 Tax=Haliangium ochraceum (strain DSM 14365 / JCM 11303 / SMP-2) TaxID=502025 RepID=D0LHQ7_HALO1|nr:carboxypeptidase-like regulatory domain-containing protein [Haliangium ochraceum]ACY12919.1 hypothetical protein Hoch_0278 [Haliangium ochraceum DSM 14365]